MSGPITPMIALGITSYANNWYNTKSVTDVKPLLFAGVGALILEGFAQIPGWEPVMTLLGWTAFVGMLISPVQNPSPVQNLLTIVGGGSSKTATATPVAGNGSTGKAKP